jgi:transketolase
LPIFDRSRFGSASGARKGAYILADAADGDPEVILLATGSEVSLVMEARIILENQGRRVRVVSMPSWELFGAQPESYRDQLLPPAVTARLAVEAAAPLGWERWVGEHGEVMGLNRFGASAPYMDIYKHLNFTPQHIAERASKLVPHLIGR